jgi:hypothetical protein
LTLSGERKRLKNGKKKYFYFKFYPLHQRFFTWGALEISKDTLLDKVKIEKSVSKNKFSPWGTEKGWELLFYTILF